MAFLLFPQPKLPPWLVRVRRVVLSNQTWSWCLLPYSGHPRGCPNYNDPKHQQCPPRAPALGGYFDLSRPLYLVVSEFDLETWAASMKAKDPRRSDRQCRCVLYWQGTARKALKDKIREAMKLLRATAVTACPEAMGMNVYATAAASGLKLEKIKDLKVCRHIAVVGWRV